MAYKIIDKRCTREDPYDKEVFVVNSSSIIRSSKWYICVPMENYPIQWGEHNIDICRRAKAKCYRVIAPENKSDTRSVVVASEENVKKIAIRDIPLMINSRPDLVAKILDHYKEL